MFIKYNFGNNETFDFELFIEDMAVYYDSLSKEEQADLNNKIWRTLGVERLYQLAGPDTVKHFFADYARQEYIEDKEVRGKHGL
nr:hypothetical protein DGKKSRWO_DGKKSRWO_CDS_0031 [uncultured phage]CAI9752160.1 hypothetical protein CVNMHQAP_CVNMHQAP_CDS_0031 [uncultured phage]